MSNNDGVTSQAQPQNSNYGGCSQEKQRLKKCVFRWPWADPGIAVGGSIPYFQSPPLPLSFLSLPLPPFLPLSSLPFPSLSLPSLRGRTP